MYRVENVQLSFRRIGKAAGEFRIGRQTRLFPDWLPGIVELELQVRKLPNGLIMSGVAGDWPAYGWLDKRNAIPERLRFDQLIRRLEQLGQGLVGLEFETVFDLQSRWSDRASRISESHPVKLCETFCRALYERGMLDALCRCQGLSFQQLLARPDQWRPSDQNSTRSASDLQAIDRRPLTRLHVRHTIGLGDPLLASESKTGRSLQRAIDRDNLKYFKIKVSGDLEYDLERLRLLAELLPGSERTITLDGNEAYASMAEATQLVKRLQKDLPDFFDRILFLEQPIARDLTLADQAKQATQRLAQLIPLVIDEADAEADSFVQAMQLGYTGVSHKNCKGIVKSLLNYQRVQGSEHGFLTGEDLTNVPLIPLHQDLTVAACLGIPHVERNGHHYFPSMEHLSVDVRRQMLADYPRLYRSDGDDRTSLELNIVDGQLDVSDLQCIGLGVKHLPDSYGRIAIQDWYESTRNDARH